MLYDLTSISGQRVRQVDEWQVNSHTWIRTPTLLIGMGGAVAGLLVAAPFMGLVGPAVLILPVVCAFLFPFLFDARKSEGGEKTVSRFRKLLNHHKALNGRFVNPGDPSVYNPFACTCIIMHNHPYYNGYADD